MCARRVRPNEEYETDDVIIGYGEVPAVHTAEGLRWVLPGRVFTACKETAIHHAKRLDRLVRANVRRYDRSLI